MHPDPRLAKLEALHQQLGVHFSFGVAPHEPGFSNDELNRSIEALEFSG